MKAQWAVVVAYNIVAASLVAGFVWFMIYAGFPG